MYWGLWPALGLAAQHVIFIRICAFWRLKTRKIFWPRRGVRLKAGAAKFPDTTWFSDPYSDFESTAESGELKNCNGVVHAMDMPFFVNNN